MSVRFDIPQEIELELGTNGQDRTHEARRPALSSFTARNGSGIVSSAKR
jgi:hypothetical protein